MDKIFVEQPSPEAKVRVMLLMYDPVKTERCKKCGKILAKPKELKYHLFWFLPLVLKV